VVDLIEDGQLNTAAFVMTRNGFAQTCPRADFWASLIERRVLTFVSLSVTLGKSRSSRDVFRMRSAMWSECGASARARNPRRSGFGHHSLRYYGRGVRCCHCTGTE
jgi:hypothetical protein